MKTGQTYPELPTCANAVSQVDLNCSRLAALIGSLREINTLQEQLCPDTHYGQLRAIEQMTDQMYSYLAALDMSVIDMIYTDLTLPF